MSHNLPNGDDIPQEIQDACRELNDVLMRCAVQGAAEHGYDESTPEKTVDKLNILLNAFCMCLVDLINAAVLEENKEHFCALVYRILMDNTKGENADEIAESSPEC